MRQQSESDCREEPPYVGCRAVIRDLTSAKEKEFAEAVKHSGTWLVDRNNDALSLLLRVLL